MSETLGTIEVFKRETKFRREPYASITPASSHWLVKNLLPAHGYGFLAGPSQGGKSFLALDWALRIASNQGVLDKRLGQRDLGVIYVASEGANGVRKRVKAWRDAHLEVRDCAFEMIGEAPDLRDMTDIGDLLNELRAASAELSAKGERLGLIVIDTLAASMPGGNENDGADMSTLLANVQRLGKDLSAFVLIVSHTGKDEARGLRGWSGQFAGADVVVMLTREEGAELRIGEVKKQKDAEAGQRFAFRLTQAVIGEDEDGEEITSALVAYAEAPASGAKAKKARALTPPEKVVFAAVTYLTNEGPTYPMPAVLGVKGGQQAVSRDDVRERAFRTGLASDDAKAGTLRMRFSRALEGLIAAEKVRQEGALLWLL